MNGQEGEGEIGVECIVLGTAHALIQEITIGEPVGSLESKGGQKGRKGREEGWEGKAKRREGSGEKGTHQLRQR